MQQETITECRVLSSNGILTAESELGSVGSIAGHTTFFIHDSIFSRNTNLLLSFTRASFNMKGCKFNNVVQNMDEKIAILKEKMK